MAYIFSYGLGQRIERTLKVRRIIFCVSPATFWMIFIVCVDACAGPVCKSNPCPSAEITTYNQLQKPSSVRQPPHSTPLN